MKTMIIGFAMAVIAIAACTNGNSTSDKNQYEIANDTLTHSHVPAMDSIGGTPFSTKKIIDGYLQLKNALVKDNGKDAAIAGNAMVIALTEVNAGSLSPGQKFFYTDLQDDIKEHAEHIAANSGKIEHQREHLVLMSRDIEDMLKNSGNNGQTLYKDFCPTANDGKGAIWFSEAKEIKNPYLGSRMPECGTVKETIK